MGLIYLTQLKSEIRAESAERKQPNVKRPDNQIPKMRIADALRKIPQRIFNARNLRSFSRRFTSGCFRCAAHAASEIGCRTDSNRVKYINAIFNYPEIFMRRNILILMIVLFLTA